MGKRLVMAALFAAYVATVYGANWAIGAFGVLPIGFGLMAPAGVYFAGLAFSLRDGLQERGGRRVVVLAILAGAVLSYALGGEPRIAVASAAAFLFSELADFAVYTPLRLRSRLAAILASNTVGTVLDSALFLWLAFGSLEFVAGQVAGKLYMTAPVIAALMLARRFAAARCWAVS